MEQVERKIITKKQFKIRVFGLIIAGSIINSILYTIGVFNGFNAYISGYMVVAGIIIGAGVGLACSRIFKIEGFDK